VPAPEPEPQLEPAAAGSGLVEAWSESRVNVAILGALLCGLTAIFLLQARLTRLAPAHRLVPQTGSCWSCWSGSAGPRGVQLLAVMFINYAMAPFHRFDLGFYRPSR